MNRGLVVPPSRPTQPTARVEHGPDCMHEPYTIGFAVMNAYVIYLDENGTTSSNRWSMYTVPGVDWLTNDDRIASLYSGHGEKDRKLVGVVRLSENVSVVLAAQPPQLGGFTGSSRSDSSAATGH